VIENASVLVKNFTFRNLWLAEQSRSASKPHTKLQKNNYKNPLLNLKTPFLTNFAHYEKTKFVFIVFGEPKTMRIWCHIRIIS
jgi:hypothetical protein